MAYKSKYFSDSEFRCKCGCNLSREDVDDSVVQLADAVREACSFPITVNSSCRCPKHNVAVGGAKQSQHIAIKGKKKSLAMDLAPPAPQQLAKLRRACDKLNKNGGVGFYKTFIHIDTRGHRARWRA